MQNQPVLKIELALKDRTIKTYTFEQDVVVVGRDPAADISIDNTGISREHTRIELNAGKTYIVKDLGSTNGTFLNDQQIQEEPLRNNDVITLGKFILRVSIEKSDAPQNRPVADKPSEDIDGTTVLSKEQMARMMASVKNDAAQKTAAPAKPAKPGTSTLPVGLMMAGGLVVLLIAGAIAFFVLR